MFFDELSDEEWTRVSTLIADEPIRLNRRGRPRAETRVVANAILWILTTGEPWSKLPGRYPSGPTCRRRFEEWLASGTLGEMVAMLTELSGRAFAYVPPPPSWWRRRRAPSRWPTTTACAACSGRTPNRGACRWPRRTNGRTRKTRPACGRRCARHRRRPSRNWRSRSRKRSCRPARRARPCSRARPAPMRRPRRLPARPPSMATRVITASIRGRCRCASPPSRRSPSRITATRSTAPRSRCRT